MTQQADVTNKKNGTKSETAPPESVSGNRWYEKYANEQHSALDIDLASFKPELFTKRDEKDPTKQVYNGLPLKGFPLAYMQFGWMDETDDNGKPVVDKQTGEVVRRPAFGYLWLLTGPLKTMRNREVHESKPGDKIIVWGNGQMKQGIRVEAANHPAKAIHMIVTPLFKGDHPSVRGQSMWRFKFEEGSVVDRGRDLPNLGVKMHQLMADAQRVHQLTQGKDADELPL